MQKLDQNEKNEATNEETNKTIAPQSDTKEQAKVPEKEVSKTIPVKKKSPKKLADSFFIDPFGKVYYGWLAIISSCYMYNLIFLIARSSFWLLQEIDYWYIWLILDYIFSDFIYLIDIFVHFLTAYIDKGEMCTNKRKIAKRYIKTFQFKLDVISLLPSDFLVFLFSSFRKHPTHLLPTLRLNRLLKYYRLSEFRYLTETQSKYPTIFRLCNLVINILLIMHWNGCVYFKFSDNVGFGSDKWVFPSLTSPNITTNLSDAEINNLLLTNELDVQYIYCFYWSVQTLTTIAEVSSFLKSIAPKILLMLCLSGDIYQPLLQNL